MRVYVMTMPTGITMIGGQVAKIIESKNPEYPVGKSLMGYWGWRSHTIVNMEKEGKAAVLPQKPYIIPEFGGLPVSLALGVLGMPG